MAPDPDLTRPESAPVEASPEAMATRRWWLRLQIALGLAGGVIWFAGSMWDREFVAGVGLGFLFSALILRLGRSAAAEE